MAGEAAVGVGERVDPGDMRTLALLHLDRRPGRRLRIYRHIRRGAVGPDGGAVWQLGMQLRLRRNHPDAQLRAVGAWRWLDQGWDVQLVDIELHGQWQRRGQGQWLR